MRSTRGWFIAIGFIIVACISISILTVKKGGEDRDNKIQQPSSFSNPTLEPTITPTSSFSSTILPQIKKELNDRNVLPDVPFVVQAPRHNWKDPVYQNACEEAVILMAMRWVEGRALTNEEAFTEIQKISDFSKAHYGFYLDQSAEDLAILMRDYFKYTNVSYRNNIQTADIKTELKNGNLVLVPVNGQKLGNPYFTQPGPTEHMLLIKGYDVKTNEFITNDAGIGKGNGYRYKEQVLDKALQRYPSGYRGKITKIEKVMIVVGKKKE